MSAPRFPTAVTGDGSTKSFPLGFPILSEAHVRVIVNGVLKVLGTDYYIQDPTAKNPTVYFPTAPTNAYAIKFYRNTPLTPSYSETLTVGQTLELYAQYRAEELADQRITLGGAAGGDFGQTALLAPTAVSFVAPCDGYLEALQTMVTKAIGTGGTLTAKIDGVTVTGMVATIANSAAVGANQRVTPTAAQASYTKVRRGQTITVLPASFATSGDVRVGIELQPADF